MGFFTVIFNKMLQHVMTASESFHASVLRHLPIGRARKLDGLLVPSELSAIGLVFPLHAEVVTQREGVHCVLHIPESNPASSSQSSIST